MALAAVALCALGCVCTGAGLLGGPTTPAEGERVPATPTRVSGGDQLDSGDELLVNLYERAVPGVVFIKVFVSDGEDLVPLATGSGFVIDMDGHIVTNEHVVSTADSLQVTFNSGSIATAEVLGTDPDADLAVIKVDVEAELLVPLPLGDSSSLRVGQRIVSIGNPAGLEGTMTLGVVSALHRNLPATADETASFQNPDIIQTDAAIYFGNSGGPLLDLQGNVVGVTTAIAAPDGYPIGLAFAVPVDTVKRVAPSLISDGEYAYPYLGVTGVTALSMAELAGPLGLPVSSGVLVADVRPGTGAADAGLQGGDREVVVQGIPIAAGGDIITAIGDHRLRDFDDLVLWLVREGEVGQTVVLTVLRDDQELQIPVTLGQRP